MLGGDAHLINKGSGDNKEDQQNEDQVDQGGYIDLGTLRFLVQSSFHARGLRVAMETSVDFFRAWATILASTEASAH